MSGFSLDIKSAHKCIAVAPEYRGLLGFQFRGALHFYVGSPCRIPSSIVAPVWLFPHADFLYVDVFHMFLSEQILPISATIICALCLLCNIRVSWKKCELTEQIEADAAEVAPILFHISHNPGTLFWIGNVGNADISFVEDVQRSSFHPCFTLQHQPWSLAALGLFPDRWLEISHHSPGISNFGGSIFLGICFCFFKGILLFFLGFVFPVQGSFSGFFFQFLEAARKEGSKEARKQGSKEARKEGSKEARKEGRKEARKQGSKEARKQGSKEGRKEGSKEARKQGSKEARKEGRKEGKKKGRKEGRHA